MWSYQGFKEFLITTPSCKCHSVKRAQEHKRGLIYVTSIFVTSPQLIYMCTNYLTIPAFRIDFQFIS